MHFRRVAVLKLFACLVLGVLAPALAPCAAQTPTGNARGGASGAAQPEPGDVVRLRIWREPDMSGEFPVDQNREVTLPRLGVMRVSGMSADSLRRHLVVSYANYLRDPSIEVTILRRVSVAGAVRTPGVFTVDPTLTVADVLALAGGASSEGRRDRVEVLRAGTTVSRNVPRGTRIGDSQVRSGDQLVVPERNWLSRNTGVVIGLATSAAFLAVAVINGR